MKKDIFWNSLGTAVWSFLSLFLLIIVTRINGITDSGLFSFAFAFALIMFTVASYTGRAYQVSDHKQKFSSSDYVSFRIITSAIAVIATMLFIAINQYDLIQSMLIFLLVIHRVLDSIADVLYGIMQKEHHLYVSGKSLFYKSTLSLVTFLVVDLLTTNLLLASLSLPIISFLFVVFYDIPRSRKLENFTVSINTFRVKKILQGTSLPFLIAVMGLIFANIARYFIDIYHPELQGYFGIIIMPLSLVILVFSFILTPAILRLTELYNINDFGALHKIIIKIIVGMSAITLLIIAGVYIWGAQLLILLFNIDFTAYIHDIALVIVIGFLLSVTSLLTNIAIIARRLRLIAIFYLFSNIVLAVMCVFLVGPTQIRGAIVAYLIASSVQTIILAFYYLHLTSTYKPSTKS